MSQEDLSRLLQLEGFDYARSTVGNWETGQATVPVSNPLFVDALAKILKMDTVTILKLSGYHIPTKHSDDAERIAQIVDSLPGDRRKLALKLVEQLIPE